MTLTLTLKNFKCWENQTFTFDEQGIVLLSGMSGKGKSTILNAILYVISGQVKNITMFGKEKVKSEVTLTLPSFTITRGKNPTVFTVKKDKEVLELEKAQTVIDSYFGSSFKHISYIDQDNQYSFVYLSPEAKMTFLRELLLSNEPIDTYREQTKQRLDRAKKEVIEHDTALGMSTSFIKSLSFTKQEPLLVGKRVITIDNVVDTMNTQKTNLEKSKKNRTILVNKRAHAEEWYNKQQKHKDIVTQLSLLGDKERFEKRLDELTHQKLRYEQQKEQREKQQKYLECIQLFEECTEKLHVVDRSFEAKLPSIDMLVNIYRHIVKLGDSMGDRTVEDLDLSLSDIQLNVQRLTDRLHPSLECPSCQTTLILKDNMLKTVTKDDSVVLDVKQLTTQLNLAKKQLDNVQKEKNRLEQQTIEYNDYIGRFDALLTTLNLSESDDFEAIQTLYRQQERTFMLLNSKREDASVQMNRFKPRGELTDVTADACSFEETIEELTTVKHTLKKIIELNTQLEAIGPIPEDMDSSTTNADKIKEYEVKIDTYTESYETLREWKRVHDMNQQYTELKESMDGHVHAKDYFNEEVKACELLLYYIKEAETSSIFEFIDGLNQHAGLYLEDFFPDEDLRVELVTTKELKSGKDKLGLFFEVSYKTIKGDIDILSGGQRDRVNLAFTLAFSELVDSKVLLLDECVSSLDSDTSDVVIDTLKEKYKNKLVICVAHQVNTGVFDKVIQI